MLVHRNFLCFFFLFDQLMYFEILMDYMIIDFVLEKGIIEIIKAQNNAINLRLNFI